MIMLGFIHLSFEKGGAKELEEGIFTIATRAISI